MGTIQFMNFVEKIVLSLRTIRNVPQMILDYAGLLHGDIIYQTYSGLKFITRSHTPDLAELIVVGSGKNYPFSFVHLLHNPTILDFGAGMGDFSLYSRYYFYKNKPTIVALEPDTENFSYLNKNIKLNNATKEIIAINSAISVKKGVFYLDHSGLANDQYVLTDTEKTDSIPCETISLNSLFKQVKISHADIVKIDIEGEEYNLLNHKPTLLLLNKKVTYLYIEYHPHTKYDYHWIIKQLYNFDLLHHEDYVLTFCHKDRHNKKMQ